LQALQDLKTRKYDEAKPAEDEWEQLTHKIIIRAFGSNSPNVGNFLRARWAGHHQIVPYGHGVPQARLQNNYDLRVQAYETVLRSCLAELKLDLPEIGNAGAARGEGVPENKIEVRVGTLLPTGDSGSDSHRVPCGWDAFICHASEDKECFVHPLAELLTRRGLKIWYDRFSLRVGDSLREAIDLGLSQSRFGIVVLSPSFFQKQWPKRELDGLVAKEVEGKKVILPIWHDVSFEDVKKYSSMLAGLYAAQSKDGLETVASQLIDAMMAEGHNLKR
jgi:hypothetical protein